MNENKILNPPIFLIELRNFLAGTNKQFAADSLAAKIVSKADFGHRWAAKNSDDLYAYLTIINQPNKISATHVDEMETIWSDFVDYKTNDNAANKIKPIFSKPTHHLKGWGEELWICNNEEYCLKLLQFNKDAKFSNHWHALKDETWYVLKGQLELTYLDLTNADKIMVILKENDVVTIKRFVPHQLRALADSTIIECSTRCFDSDSYRIEKGDSQLTK